MVSLLQGRHLGTKNLTKDMVICIVIPLLSVIITEGGKIYSGPLYPDPHSEAAKDITAEEQLGYLGVFANWNIMITLSSFLLEKR